jgi:hypothetical protein
MEADHRASLQQQHRDRDHHRMLSRHRLGLLPLLAALAACSPHVEGNGVYAEIVLDASQVAPFDRLAIDLPRDERHVAVRASVGALQQPRQVVVGGDENVIQHVRPLVDGGRLRLRMDLDSYTVVHPLQLRIQAPELVGVEATAGADVTVLGAQASSFSVIASAEGHITLAGDGGATLLVDLSGGAQLDAVGYPVASAQLALTGASRATVWPSGQVVGSAAEGSALLVKGGVACEVALTSGATCGALP